MDTASRDGKLESKEFERWCNNNYSDILAGLMMFYILKDFTLIKERQPIEVSLWNEYLMFAQMFGIADEVAKQFKELYPEVIASMNSIGYDYGDVVYINHVSRSGIRSSSNVRSMAESYSSGGGIFFWRRGGGSFGGGGGGGDFR